MTSKKDLNLLPRHLVDVTSFYQEKIAIAGVVDATGGLRVVSKEVERDGVHGKQDNGDQEQVK
jgi:hypothetical protein